MEVKLSRGLVGLIDDADWPIVSRYKWYANWSGNTYYARTSVTLNGKRTKLLMHRLLLDAPKGMHVDHKNGNTLDNRRCNIRVATPSQNQMNSQRARRCRGAHFRLDVGRWKAQITKDGRTHYLGLFDTPEEAHAAYVAKAREIFGEFMRPTA